MRHRLFFLALVGSCLSTSVMAQPAQRETLPADVVPSHYDLAIHPDLDALTFTGTNAVTLDVKNPTADITLNAKGLTIDKATLETGAAGTATLDTTLERATIHFAAPLSAGQHRLTIAYHGAIGHDTLGIFAMDYDTPQGKQRMLATNLEPASARQVFPGWDEPGIKASYTVTVDAPAGRMALSNMPVASITPLSPTLNRVTFAQSPRMASYLFFLGIGDWERIHQNVDGVDVGVVVKRGDTAKAGYALQQASSLLHWYNGWFGTAYPLPKLDLIAAPGSIQGGSMENWGAILYSQNHLLFNPATSTEGDRQLVFEVVAHEMAHQWFGDLVTMDWWDNLWLNEGFARWMQTYAADALHKEWETGLKAQDIFEEGRAVDALPSSHPILQTVTTANQALQAFDSITYEKGAAVIAMLAHDIGDAPFRTGVQRYMKAHAYGNTVDADLWGVMQQVAGKPILGIEHDFTAQVGVPLIRVTVTAQGLHLAEDIFRSTGPGGVPGGGPDATRWHIPLTLAPIGGTDRSLLLADKADVALRGPVLVNAGQTAYARVLYPQALFDSLLPRVPAMAPVDQLGLMQDGVALGNAGYAPLSRALAVAARLPAGADPVVWQRVADMLREIDSDYRASPRRAAFRQEAIGLLRPALAAVGAQPRPGEAANVAILRARLREVLGALGDPATVAQARAVLASGQGTPAEQRSALAIAAAKADPALFDRLLARARATVDPLEKLRLYAALAGAEDETLAPRIADLVLSREVPAGTNEGLLIRFAAAHPDLAWHLTIARLGQGDSGMNKQMQWDAAMRMAEMSSDPSRIAEFQAYLAANVPADARPAMQGAIASIQLNHRIESDVLPDLDRWIADHAHAS
jgi:aminopeptidase N